MSFTVAIVGRPNVGKSTLFNRLTGKRHALVDDQPGVTRDRRAGDASLGGMPFTVVDTAGLEDAEEGTLAARMTDQSKQAIKDADVALLVIDGRAGVTPMDKYFAQIVRKSGTPVILLVNKAEGGKASTTIAEAHGLGMGEPVAISAEHGEGLADLYDALAPYDKNPDGVEDGPVENINTPMQIAIVGRRDAITIEHEFKGRKLKLVDTAGMRRKANVQAKVEKLAVADTLRAIQYAHVVVLVVDAEQPLEKQEATIASLVEQEGRAMVVAVNKWDMVTDKPAYEKAIKQRLVTVLPQVKGVPLVYISGQEGFGIGALLKACFDVYALWNTEIGTGELNRWLEAAIEEHTPPMVSARRIKIRYMTQKTARPPSFILFSNTSDVPESYMRYLVNSMRERFKLPGIPIRVRIRKNKNPYADGADNG